MGYELVPRMKRKRRNSIHYNIGGMYNVTKVMAFAGVPDEILKNFTTSNNYVRSAEARVIADRLDGLLNRLEASRPSERIPGRSPASSQAMKYFDSFMRDIEKRIGPNGFLICPPRELSDLLSDPSMIDDLRSFSAFCRSSGGFYVW